MDKKINPDTNTQLPRENHNIANDMGPIPERIGAEGKHVRNPRPLNYLITSEALIL